MLASTNLKDQMKKLKISPQLCLSRRRLAADNKKKVSNITHLSNNSHNPEQINCIVINTKDLDISIK